MKKVLVTGGTGYIGSHTCVELLNAGYEVIVVDSFYNSSSRIVKKIELISKKNLKVYNGDIRDKRFLEHVFCENNIDIVIHFAGLKSVAESCSQPLLYYDNNVSGTITLCQVMKSHSVKNLIFSSSATVYNYSANVPYNEDTPTGEVCNPYGRTKYIIEEFLKDLYLSDQSWNIILLRYFNPIGAHESGLIGENPKGIPNNLMPYICQVAAGKLPELTIFGDNYDTPDGTCVRDYIHVVDLAMGHIKALDKLSYLNGSLEIYNLGTGKGYSVLELIKIFENVNNVKIKYKIGPRRKGDLPIVYSNVNKSKSSLNWYAKFKIEKMCKDAWHWQKLSLN